MKKHYKRSAMMKYLLILFLSGLSLNAMAQSITLKKSNENLKNVIEEFSKQAKVEFMYNDELISKYKVTVDFNKTPFAEAMVSLFKGLPLKYATKNGVIVISPDNTKKIAKPKGEEFTLHGMVTAKDDKTVAAGATVLVDGTTNGAIIGFDGKFSLKVRPGDVLTISYVGMKEVRYTVGASKENVHIEMERSNLAVDDVIITGYGNIKAHENVGAVTTLSGKDLDQTANRNLSQMLQGKIAGLVVTNSSGMVGTRQKVKVRGTSTLLGNQEPVWVVDGMIQEDPLPFKTSEFNAFGDVNPDNIEQIRNFIGGAISWLNPNDIETITVLKDASATAIYGVKAANGVIVITTKRGKEGKISVSYSGNFSMNQKTNYDKLNLMNSKERVDVSREIIQNGYISATAGAGLSDIGYEGAYKKYMNREIGYEEFNRRAKAAETVNTDWLDLLMRNSMSNGHSVSLSGGSDRISYYSSLNANFNKGEDKNNQTESYGASVTINAWIIPEKLSVDTRLSGSMNNTTGVMVSSYDYAVKTNRSIDAYNELGERYFYPYSGIDGSLLYNFENERDNSSNKNKQTSLNGSVAVTWKIIKGLDFNASLGYALSNSEGTAYFTERSYAMSQKRGYDFGTTTTADIKYKQSKLPHGGQYNYTQSKNFNYTARAQMSYNHTFKGEHRITGSLGYEMRSSKYDGYNETIFGYIPDRGHTFSRPPLTVLGGGSIDAKMERNSIYEDESNSVTDRLSNYISGYMTAGYSYKERYIISGNIRSDASNRFGQDSNAKFLPVFSVGLRWNVAEEAWMLNQDVVNNLAFRASYGWQGNVAENFGPDLIATVVGQPDALLGEYMLKIKSLPYPDLKWEKVKSYNIGADFGLFKNKLQVSFNYYYKRTEDMIVSLSVPFSFGVASMPINGGNMSNSGWDLSLTTTPIRTKHFSWNLSFNTAVNNNKIDSELVLKQDWRTAVGGNLNKEGYPISSVWSFKYLGLDPNTGVPVHYFPNEGDPGVNPNDATTFMDYAGQLEPDFTGGLSTSFNYKNLSLSASFNLSIGSIRFLTDYVTSLNNLPISQENMSREFNDRWRKKGDELLPNVKPSLPRDGVVTQLNFFGNNAYPYDMYNKSDKRVVNGNFLRCNNISLSYTLPEKLVNKIGLGNLSVNAGMSNPFKIVSKDYKGVDPEVATGSSPLLKSYNFGISITL